MTEEWKRSDLVNSKDWEIPEKAEKMQYLGCYIFDDAKKYYLFAEEIKKIKEKEKKIKEMHSVAEELGYEITPKKVGGVP